MTETLITFDRIQIDFINNLIYGVVKLNSNLVNDEGVCLLVEEALQEIPKRFGITVSQFERIVWRNDKEVIKWLKRRKK